MTLRELIDDWCNKANQCEQVMQSIGYRFSESSEEEKSKYKIAQVEFVVYLACARELKRALNELGK